MWTFPLYPDRAEAAQLIPEPNLIALRRHLSLRTPGTSCHPTHLPHPGTFEPRDRAPAIRLLGLNRSVLGLHRLVGG